MQLCDTLFYENSNVDIELIDVENEGSCIKFSPLDTAQGIFQILLPKWSKLKNIHKFRVLSFESKRQVCFFN